MEVPWHIRIPVTKNKSAECVAPKDRFKFVDDLTIIEIVNLLTI